jgi:hypothetical protein
MYQKKLMSLVTSFSLAAAGAFALSAPGVFADFTSVSNVTDNSVAAGTVDVDLVSATGQLQTAPILAVTDAGPSMAAQTSTIRIKNNGTLPAAIELTSADLVASAGGDLNDVLRLVVRDQNNQVIYTGTVSGLSIEIPSLAAGVTLNWSVAVNWPDLVGVDDNPYQGAVLAFEFQVAASNLVI